MNAEPSRRVRRTGFTLVELLVVIVIIGILIALLVPVIAGAVRTAKDAAVTSEITLLANGIGAFKERYGDVPPSRVILVEDGVYDITSTTALSAVAWLGGYNPNRHLDVGVGKGTQASARYSGTDLTYGELAQRSVRFLRKFFNRATFSTNTALPANQRPFYDFNGNGVLDTAPILLEGHECLVFFLGGLPSQASWEYGAGGPIGTVNPAMSGFARNPANPFVYDGPTNGTTNRYPPFFEFRSDRLVDDDGDGIPGYVDSINAGSDARFYAYFASYGNNGYDPNDTNFAEGDASGAATIGRYFGTNFSVNDTITGSGKTNVLLSATPNPYTTTPAIGAGKPVAYMNGSTYQIISAGRDGYYGFGGQYTPDGGDKLPVLVGEGSVPNGQPPLAPAQPELRKQEADNLTNFATGRLE